MNNYFVILAAGTGKRFSKNTLKQYQIYKNRPVIDHSIIKALKSKLFKKVIIVVKNEKNNSYSNSSIKVIKGGKERSDSSLLALKYLKKFKPTNVLIHDAARPDFSINLLKKIIKNLKKHKAVIPALKSKDTLKYKIKRNYYNLDRNNSFLTQTPQGFRFSKLLDLSTNNKNLITDEATLFINQNEKIKFIDGEDNNNKITFKKDLNLTKNYFGIGFDIHRLIKRKKLYLGGVKIPFHSGLKGHSDGDVILHSIIDALLGAMRKKDIGTFFPDNKNKFKNIRSPKMLKPIISIFQKENYYINNLDINLICEKPKVLKFRDKIIKSISNLMDIDKSLINLKGKTVEKLGLIGKEQAIACEVIISIMKYE
jgi:2-C-methyl-D-erythritol 4-phosphate cytidylyltransferase/2-C-methyl-D-erythritol 2,4-cyclodiphosphate synthase